ncbi:MAG: hypothetical protein JWQ98_3358 [Chlorobi bacterium]|nr:hypothetical protein [Chlorobiota bacterium]
MAELKTKETDESVDAFLDGVADEKKRDDSRVILDLMKGATGMEPRMWGSSMIGFGQYHYVYESGREGDWFITGFSPRKANLTIYITGGLCNYEELLKKLGKHRQGKGCLYINRIEDIDLAVFRELIETSAASHKNTET